MRNRAQAVKWSLSASVLSLALGAVPAAHAQQAAEQPAPVASNDGLKDIVVTAQKREQNLQRVGISVTAITGDQIRERGITSSIDLITQTPSVDNYSPYGPGSSANIVIRGVGLNDFGEGNEAPVTVYVDEFYVVNVPAVDFALFDLERAEILRGPQGTLFGRNSTGGLVNYVTEKPGDTFSGYVKGSFARFNELKIEGAVNVPITDNLSGRLSFLSHHSDGYIHNLNPAFSNQNGGAAGTDAIRAQLRWRPDAWDVDLKVEYGRRNSVHTYYEQTPSTRDPVTGLASLNPNGTDAAGYNPKNFGAGAPNVTDTNRPQWLQSEGTTVLLRAERKIADHLTFTSVTGYQHFSRHYVEDCDASPNDTCYARFPFKADSASQEFRLFYSHGPVRWTAGLYGLYSSSKNNPYAVFNVPISGPTAVDPKTGLYDGAFFPVNLAANWRLHTASVAAFAQGEYDLTPTLTAILGARVTHDDKDFLDHDNASLRTCPEGGTNCFLPAEGGDGIANPFHGRYKKTLWSGKAELDFKPNNTTLLFASISRGTKSGGFSNGFYPGGVKTSQLRYGAETNIAYEIGEKLTLFDHKLRFNTSLFYYDYRNFQTFNWEGVGGLLANHNARSYGAETEIQAAPTANLRLTFGGSYLHTEIEGVTNGTPSGGTYTANRQMANAPKWTADGSISYTIPLAGERSIVFDWDGNYRSSRYTNNFNDPSVRLKGYFKHNASITYNLDEHLQLQAFVRNISNNLAATKAYQFNDLGYTQFIYSEPRVFGGSVMYKW